MRITWPTVRLDRAGWLTVAGAAGSLAVAAILFSRYSIDGSLSRDESIYVYGGQQLTHGVAPYDSIFDPKAPLAAMICGLGAGLANLFGTNDVYLIRALFYLCSVLVVVAVYVLVVQVWHSVIGGLAAAVVFASYKGFAQDALAGPDAKTPGVLFLVLSMWLAVRRNWFWAAFAGSLAFLVWQPFLIFPVIPLVYAAVSERERRWRAVGLAAAGAAAPVAVTFVYFAAVGAVGNFVESAFSYPLTGVKRGRETFGGRLEHIGHVVHEYYAFSGVLFWIGAVLLVLVAVEVVLRSRPNWRASLDNPVLLVIMLGALFEFGYALTDFQSYPDVYPLLAFPAIGIGATVALVHERVPPIAARGVASAVGVALALLAGLSAFWFGDSRANNTFFRGEQAAGCALRQVIVPGTSLYSLGDPMELVVTGLRNPDRFIYLDSGVAKWKVDHLSGGFDAWTEQLSAANPSVVVVQAWVGEYVTKMEAYLRAHGYQRFWLGPARLFLTTEAQERAEAAGLQLTGMRTRFPLQTDGRWYDQRSCGIG